MSKNDGFSLNMHSRRDFMTTAPPPAYDVWSRIAQIVALLSSIQFSISPSRTLKILVYSQKYCDSRTQFESETQPRYRAWLTEDTRPVLFRVERCQINNYQFSI